MTTTPPAQTIVEPPTPLHGARFDSGPKAVRKSTRSSSYRSERTPSPNGTENLARSSGPSTPRRSSRRVSSNTYSPPSSNPTSPQTMPRKRGKAAATFAKASDDHRTATSDSLLGMLPTPVKTPAKKELKQLDPASRVLFPGRSSNIEDAMPTPKKRARKHVGFSLQSFEEDNIGNSIEIYTDSKDKLPELDTSADNPFYVTRSKNGGAKKKRSREVETNKNIQKILEQDEGMVYVFRGKKIYKKFDQDDYDQLPGDHETSAEGIPLNELDSPRHFTRSTVQPRRLFLEATTSDEEAVTDIEEQITDHAEEAETPIKTKFTITPATPPQTGHGKEKFKNVLHKSPVSDVESSPRPIKKAKRPSPFMGWQRTKSSSASSGTNVKGKKREASEELERVEEGKRVRSM